MSARKIRTKRVSLSKTQKLSYQLVFFIALHERSRWSQPLLRWQAGIYSGSGTRRAYSPPGPWAVIMSVHGATMEDIRESEVLWWVPLMILLPAFKKTVQGIAGGSKYSTWSQQYFSFPEGLKVREPCQHGGLQGVRSVWWVLLRILSKFPQK